MSGNALALIILVQGLTVSWFANEKGRSVVFWFLAGMVIPVLSLGLVLALPELPDPPRRT